MPEYAGSPKAGSGNALGCALLSIALAVMAASPAAAESKRKAIPQPAPPAEPVTEKKESPNLQETTDWLKEKLLAYSGATYNPGKMQMTEKYDAFRFEGCTVSYRTTYLLATSETTVDTVFSLADIEPSSVKSLYVAPRGFSIVAMKTENGVNKVSERKKMTYHLQTRAGDTVTEDAKQSSQVQITVSDEPMAQRVAKAFENAATLCRTKKEAF